MLSASPDAVVMPRHPEKPWRINGSGLYTWCPLVCRYLCILDIRWHLNAVLRYGCISHDKLLHIYARYACAHLFCSVLLKFLFVWIDVKINYNHCCFWCFCSSSLLYRQTSGFFFKKRSLGDNGSKGRISFMLPIQQDQNMTHTHTHNRLTALCPELPGWAGTWRNIHPLTPILIIKHPLSTFSIYYDPWHPPCSISVLDSPLLQPVSKSSLVFLLVRDPLLHTSYISSRNHYLLFATHAHTIKTDTYQVKLS